MQDYYVFPQGARQLVAMQKKKKKNVHKKKIPKGVEKQGQAKKQAADNGQQKS